MMDPAAICTIVVSSVVGGIGLFSCIWICLSCNNGVAPATPVETIKITVQEQPPIYTEEPQPIQQMETIIIAPPPGYVE